MASALTDWMAGVGGIATAFAFIAAALGLYLTERKNRSDRNAALAADLRREMRTVVQSAKALQTQMGGHGLVNVAMHFAGRFQSTYADLPLHEGLGAVAGDDYARRRLVVCATLDAPLFDEVRATVRRLELADVALRGGLRVISTPVRLLVRSADSVWSVNGLTTIWAEPDYELPSELLELPVRDVPVELIERYFLGAARSSLELVVAPLVRETVDLIDASFSALSDLDDETLILLIGQENPEANATETFTEEIAMRLADLRAHLPEETYARLLKEAQDIEEHFAGEGLEARLGTLVDPPKRDTTVEEDEAIVARLVAPLDQREAEDALTRLTALAEDQVELLVKLTVDELKSRRPESELAPGLFLSATLTSDPNFRALVDPYEPRRVAFDGALFYQLTTDGHAVARILIGPLPSAIEDDAEIPGRAAAQAALAAS